MKSLFRNKSRKLKSRKLKLRKTIIAALVLALAFANFAGAQDLDFDGDGLDEVILIQVQDTEELQWKLLLSTRGYAAQINTHIFGAIGDHLAPGSWTSADKNEVGVVSLQGKRVLWKILGSDGEVRKVRFGKKNDWLIAGGDFSGDGISDIAVLNKFGRLRVLVNPFEVPQQFDLKIPRATVKRGERPFFLRSGTVDSLALLFKEKSKGSKASLQVFQQGVNSSSSREQKRFPLPKKVIDIIPFHIAGSDGAYLTISKRKQSRLAVLRTADGNELWRKIFSANRTVLVGNYLEAEGQEVGLFGNGLFYVENPITGDTKFIEGVPSGIIPADLYNVNRFDQPTFSSDVKGTDDEQIVPNPLPEETPGSSGGLSDACPNGTQELTSGALWKPSSDVSDARGGKPVLLLTGSFKNGSRSGIEIFDSEGGNLCLLTYKTPSQSGVNKGADHYYSGWIGGCGKSAGQIASEASANTGSEQVYLAWKGGKCLGPLNPRSRAGDI